MENSNTIEVPASEFDATLDRYISDLGYRLEMIMPADAPRKAVLRKPARKQGRYHEVKIKVSERGPKKDRVDTASRSDWSVGRAGMMYRSLIPDRLGGKVVASHIRIVTGGEVSDSVHYHKIRFQIIYCLKGAIRVVYEDQGEPFWLHPGDCVLQPPHIRHRVLEARAGSEVIEITSPAEHETWFDHEMELPTDQIRPNRGFQTQRFARHKNAEAAWQQLDDGITMCARTKIADAGSEMPDVYALSSEGIKDVMEWSLTSGISLRILIKGRGIEVRGLTI